MACLWLSFADMSPLPTVPSALIGAAIVVVVVGSGWLIARAYLGRERETATARSAFLMKRPEFETMFFWAACATGKPRGLRWKACEWSDCVEFAREKQTGNLAALVGVTIQFEAIVGGDLEGVPQVDKLRNESALVFSIHRRAQPLALPGFSHHPYTP